MLTEVGYQTYHTIITFWSWWWEFDNQIDELSRNFLTISVITLLLIWYKNVTSHLPPGPYGLPIVGYLPFLGSNLHETFTDLSHKYGPIFSLHLGSKLHVVVSSIDLAKVVARDKDHTFSNRNPPVTALAVTYGGFDIAWSNNNTHWRNMRKLLVSQVLSNMNLNECQSFRMREVRKMVNKVYRKIGTKVDVNKIAFDTQLNVVTSMVWGCNNSCDGKDLSLSEDGFREIVSKIVELQGVPNISDFFPLISRFDLQGKMREMRRQLEYVDRIFESVIHTRINANSNKMKGAIEADLRKDFVQILLENKDYKDDPKRLNIAQIKALLMDIVLGATDTTVTMVEWVMVRILQNPGVMKKVQEELTEVIGMTNIVEEFHFPKLKYLDAVIKETFRLHPPLPLLIHRCPDETCKVGGYTIPKGSIVHINIRAIHQDPENWTNPMDFKPERFLSSKWDYKGSNFKFLPFGSGRRICPGIVLGQKMLIYILASLLHYFEWSLPKDEELELSDEFGLVTKKKKPLIALPTKRLSDTSLYY